MTIRSRREKVHFWHPFQIKGIDRSLPIWRYEVITDEEMIECARRQLARRGS